MAEIVYDLIKLEEFVIKPSATGEEYIAVGQNGTYRIKSSDLINAVAAQQGFIKAVALTPLNNQVSSLNTSVSSLNTSVSSLNTSVGSLNTSVGSLNVKTSELRTDVDSKIPQANVVNNLTTPSSAFVLSAKQGKILNDRISDFASQIGSGILGEAKPDTVPIVARFGIYTVSDPGTFINFPDINSDPLIVSQAELDSGLVQLWGNDNVWEKHVTLIDVFTPVFSDNLSDI